MLDSPITDEDLEFVRDLIGQTQTRKVTWTLNPEGHYVAERPRVIAVLLRSGTRPRRVKLALRRRGSGEEGRVLSQHIDPAEPDAMELAMNSLLAYLWQLVAVGDSQVSRLYDDFNEEG